MSCLSVSAGSKRSPNFVQPFENRFDRKRLRIDRFLELFPLQRRRYRSTFPADVENTPKRPSCLGYSAGSRRIHDAIFCASPHARSSRDPAARCTTMEAMASAEDAHLLIRECIFKNRQMHVNTGGPGRLRIASQIRVRPGPAFSFDRHLSAPSHTALRRDRGRKRCSPDNPGAVRATSTDSAGCLRCSRCRGAGRDPLQ